MKRKMAPIVEDRETKVRDNEKKVTHPAFGSISISRTSCSPPIQLFGSDVKHGHFITLRINTAEKYTDGNHSFIFTRKPLVEVYLSGVQFGELLTSMNVGEGVPCTLNRTENDYDIPEIVDNETPITESRKALQDRIDRVMGNAKSMIDKTEELLAQKTVSKKDLKEIKDNLYIIKQELNSNISYVAKSFDEKMETTISHAKGEVEAFVSSTITKAGLNAIQNGYTAVEIPYNNNVTTIEE